MRRALCAVLVVTLNAGSVMAAPTNIRAALASELAPVAKRELEAKHIPAFAIAVLDKDGVIWSAAWSSKGLASPQTLFRAGSTTKTLTALIAQQLVDEKRLDLDAPVSRYLPTFAPANPYGAPITTRLLLSHRAGLVREPPLGSYFDDSRPDLRRTVESLNQTRLVHEPGSGFKYSNAGYAVVGRILEEITGQSWEDLVRGRIFAPSGMRDSLLARADDADIAEGRMVSFDGERFAAPTFELATSPAGGLYTNAEDLAHLAQALLRGGRGAHGAVASPAGLARMVRPAGGPGEMPYGLGLSLRPFDGHRQLSHGGAVYGHVTEFRILPDDNLAVVAFAASDAGPTAGRIADQALRTALAVRSGKAAPAFIETRAPAPEVGTRLEGRYVSGRASINLRFVAGRLLADTPTQAGELRRSPDDWCLDDAITFQCGFNIANDGMSIRVGETTFARQDAAASPPAPLLAERAGLIGDYGFDHNILRIYERDGELFARTEWIEFAPLTRRHPDEWAFPAGETLYAKETVQFRRGADGTATAAVLSGIVFPRRDLGAEAEARLAAGVKADADLLARAQRAQPPAFPRPTREADLVAITDLDPRLGLDIRYATAGNFMGVPVYSRPQAYLQRPAAEALSRVQDRLKPHGFGLLIHDAYRPWFVTKAFWDATPPNAKIFVADPALGSKHNRGAAVDLTLVELATGRPVVMPGRYDEMSSRSFPHFVGGGERERWSRDLLRWAMQAEGFVGIDSEWWHFDYRDWAEYPIQNVPFERLAP